MTRKTEASDTGAPTARDSRMAGFPVPPPGYWEAAMAAGWPLQTYLELGPLMESVRTARQHAGQVAWEWGCSDLRLACELIVDELMSNAVRAARALDLYGPVRLWLLSDKERVLILIWDSSPHAPSPVAEADLLAESGRGLRLVSEASEQWWWYYTADGGKVVWALCSEAFE